MSYNNRNKRKRGIIMNQKPSHQGIQTDSHIDTTRYLSPWTPAPQRKKPRSPEATISLLIVLTLVHLLDDFTPDKGERMNRSCFRPFWYTFSFPGEDGHVDVSDFADGDGSVLGHVLFADDDRRAGMPIFSSSVDHAVSSLERSNFLTVPDSVALSLSTGCEMTLLLRSDPSRIEGNGGFLLDSVLSSDADMLLDLSLLPMSRSLGLMWDIISSLAWAMIGTLVERLPSELVMFATLSLRITVVAELRTRCSLLDRLVMPGNGKSSRLHTSASRASRRTRSPREGAKTGVLELVVNKDWERLIGRLDEDVDVSFMVVVFFSMTWHRADLGPTVVALWIDTRRATVPKNLWARILWHNHRGTFLPGFPNTVPRLFIFRNIVLYGVASAISRGSIVSERLRRARHSASSFGVQAVSMIS